MDRAEAFQDGREQGHRNNQAEIEKLTADIARIKTQRDHALLDWERTRDLLERAQVELQTWYDERNKSVKSGLLASSTNVLLEHIGAELGMKQ